MTGQEWLWILFAVFVVAAVVLDLGVFHRRAEVVRMRAALLWSAFWIGLALLFNAGIYLTLGAEKALLFLSAYLMEKSLSVDNLFVFLLVFSYFNVPPLYQRRVLFWGIVAAALIRGIFILAGVALIAKFHWLVYVFGAFLVVTGLRMLKQGDKEIHPEKNPILRAVRRFITLTHGYEGERFFVVRAGRRMATPLFVVLIVIETTDVVFAVDSVPAVLALTLDPFIVYTSNIFAILGLRALYFALAGVMQIFHYLHYGLSAILVFVGVKMLLANHYKIPTLVALGVIAGAVLASVVASLLRPRQSGTTAPEDLATVDTRSPTGTSDSGVRSRA
jgi:tellurite resistance protein TerC